VVTLKGHNQALQAWNAPNSWGNSRTIFTGDDVGNCKAP